MLVSAFKEKIADEVGLPVGQQRLIFRGKVLKDEHHLSEYRILFTRWINMFQSTHQLYISLPNFNGFN
ncbi:putative Ubiquitin-like domain-containing protein [Helianthus debilis subsp. tardiflorus]